VDFSSLAGVQPRMKNLAPEGEAIALQQQFRRSHECRGRRKSFSRNSDLEWTEHKGAAGPKGTDLVRRDQRCWGRLDGWLSSGSSATRGDENSRIGRAILSSGSGGLESTATDPSPSQRPPTPNLVQEQSISGDMDPGGDFQIYIYIPAHGLYMFFCTVEANRQDFRSFFASSTGNQAYLPPAGWP
jgi:hypothetical protein